MLQNCVMDEIFAKNARENRVPNRMAQTAYDKTVKGSPLRKASIHILAFRSFLGNEEHSMLRDANLPSFTVEILRDLIIEIHAARKNQGKVPVRDKCFFHVHGKDEHCWNLRWLEGRSWDLLGADTSLALSNLVATSFCISSS